MGALHDRIYSTAIMCASKQPDRIAAAMFVRAAICLEALHEMRGWPAGKVAGITGEREAEQWNFLAFPNSTVL
jgi:hypothetical protein